MGRNPLWSAEVEQLGGANYLVIVRKADGPRFGVLVSRIHGQTKARPMRTDRSYPAIARGAVPPEASERAIMAAARYAAAPYLDGDSRFA